MSVSVDDDESRSEVTPRHVVVITLDTTRADHFGFLGNQQVETPHFDALAAESIVLSDFMTVAPTTLASHTSLFTGKHPHHHGTPRNGFMVNRANAMLAEVLQRQGFHTAGFVGSFALDSRFDFAQGFDHYDEDLYIHVGDGGADQDQRSSTMVTDAVIKYLDQIDTPERLFLFAHYFDPHQPYTAPGRFTEQYDSESDTSLWSVADVRGTWFTNWFRQGAKQHHAQRHALRYAAEVSYLDSEVGRLLETLRDRGILDEAILVIASDHGETFLEHDEEFDHGHEVYQTTVRAVGMIRQPNGGTGGTAIGTPASTIDLFPTILEAVQVSPPASIDGVALDLRGTLSGTGETDSDRVLFGQATKPWEEVETDPRWYNIRKARYVRQGRFKFIQTPYAGTEELYDLAADPCEQVNLLVDGPETASSSEAAQSLRRQLEAWAASAAPLSSGFESSQQDETIQRLRGLGYLR